MKKILTILVASILLTACNATTDGEFRPKTTVRVISSMSYPEFPNIEPLPPVAVLPWEHDLPRDTTIVSVKNITACRKVETYSPEDKPHVVLPKEEQSIGWWKKCGENPISPDSNIFIGFTQTEWNIVLENFAKLRERIWQYRQRIIEVNRQRQEWRDKVEQERIRLSDENNPKAKSVEKSKETKEESFFDKFLR